jgi:hypothetical protein
MAISPEFDAGRFKGVFGPIPDLAQAQPREKTFKLPRISIDGSIPIPKIPRWSGNTWGTIACGVGIAAIFTGGIIMDWNEHPLFKGPRGSIFRSADTPPRYSPLGSYNPPPPSPHIRPNPTEIQNGYLVNKPNIKK